MRMTTPGAEEETKMSEVNPQHLREVSGLQSLATATTGAIVDEDNLGRPDPLTPAVLKRLAMTAHRREGQYLDREDAPEPRS